MPGVDEYNSSILNPLEGGIGILPNVLGVLKKLLRPLWEVPGCFMLRDLQKSRRINVFDHLM